MKKTAITLLSSAILFSPFISNYQVEASTFNKVDSISLSNVNNNGIELYGAVRPNKDSDIHNISKSPYNYQIEKVGAQVYTSKFIKGKKTMEVTVENWSLVEEYAGTNNELNITLYNSKDTKVTNKKIKVSQTSSVKFTGLSASEKYYIGFSVPTNGNKYSFNGSIK